MVLRATSDAVKIFLFPLFWGWLKSVFTRFRRLENLFIKMQKVKMTNLELLIKWNKSKIFPVNTGTQNPHQLKSKLCYYVYYY